jgi:hypothetical protein
MVKFIYVVPAFAADRQRDISGEIADMALYANEWLASQNGGIPVRLDMYQGSPDVVFHSLEITREEWYSWFPAQLLPAVDYLREAGFAVPDGAGVVGSPHAGQDLYFVVWEAPAGDYAKTGAGAGSCRPTIDALNSGPRLVGFAAAMGDGSPCPTHRGPFPFSGSAEAQRQWFGQGNQPFIDHVVQAMRYLPGCGYPVSPKDGELYTVPGTDIVERRGGFIRDILEPHDPIALRMTEAAVDARPTLDVHQDTYFNVTNGPLASVACNSDIAKSPLWHAESVGERSTVDLPDDLLGPQVHAVYVLARGARDRNFDRSGEIESALRQFDGFLRSQTGGTGVRLDTYEGRLDVTYLRLDRAASDFSVGQDCSNVPCPNEATLLEEYGRTNVVDPEKIYVFFYEGGLTYSSPLCGGARRGQAVLMNLEAFRENSCELLWVAPRLDSWSIGLHTGHEVLHALGAVCTKNSDGYGHAAVPGDLMHGQASGPAIALDPRGTSYWGPGAGEGCDVSTHPIFTAAQNRRP